MTRDAEPSKRTRLTARSDQVHGARENNLKEVSIELPKAPLTVFTGRLGLRKSSLVIRAQEPRRMYNPKNSPTPHTHPPPNPSAAHQRYLQRLSEWGFSRRWRARGLSSFVFLSSTCSKG